MSHTTKEEIRAILNKLKTNELSDDEAIREIIYLYYQRLENKVDYGTVENNYI